MTITPTNDLAIAINFLNTQGHKVTLPIAPPIEFLMDDGVQQQELQQRSDWGYHDGGTFGIGGVATRSHATSLQQDGSRLFSITGPYKATGLWYLAVPTLGWKTGLHTLSCDFMYISGPNGMDEFDGRLEDANGYGYNYSSAAVWSYPDVAPADSLVVSGDVGQWLVVPNVKLTPFQPNVWYHRAIVMEINFETRMFGIVSVQVGSNIYPVSQNFKAIPSNWTRNEILIQVQPYASADGTLEVAVNNLNVI